MTCKSAKFNKLESQRSKSLGIRTIGRFEALRDEKFENLVFSKIRQFQSSRIKRLKRLKIRKFEFDRKV